MAGATILTTLPTEAERAEKIALAIRSVCSDGNCDPLSVALDILAADPLTAPASEQQALVQEMRAALVYLSEDAEFQRLFVRTLRRIDALLSRVPEGT